MRRNHAPLVVEFLLRLHAAARRAPARTPRGVCILPLHRRHRRRRIGGRRGLAAEAMARGIGARLRRHADARNLARAGRQRPALQHSARLFRGTHRRRRDGSHAQALREFRRLAPVLLSRRVGGRTHLHRDFRLHQSGRAHLRGKTRHRVSAHQHPARREGRRRPRPHLSAAGRPRALRRHRGRNPARRVQPQLRAPDGIRSRARARTSIARPKRRCPSKIDPRC